MTSTKNTGGTSSGQLVGIHYSEPRVKMVQFLLERGSTPSDVDKGETVWARFIVSMYLLTIEAKVQFSEQAKSWFEITKLMLLRGADPHMICPVNAQPGKPIEISTTGQTTAMDVLFTIFGADARFDVSELEDLVEQPQRPPQYRNANDSYLQVPGNQQGVNVWRTHSSSSSISSISGQSAMPPSLPAGYSQAGNGGIPTASPPVVEAPDMMVHIQVHERGALSTPPRKKRHSRLSSLFAKILPREKTPPHSPLAPDIRHTKELEW
ncbi:hypothetical protein PAAG_11452 [Paracoccidioides lutzii Pb01]|uniref:Ankyrin repeat protein n=1 Tax=Paracoccidioides lutzii (strain ATCC MYA-826 / Pb01) TaxID=502779 RepID=A0A0A2VLL1_PARBA|nr:hypothetical protein PAAG_11452 [Paracoccidioides lutzii Pb01]KGQ01734.1 hypothetical protein PAAG_11452 [Paracoccidioides lutzii Pb01]